MPTDDQPAATRRVRDPQAHVEARKLRSHLNELTAAVGKHLRALDAEMKKPSDVERGKRIAALANDLDLANDRARYFGLGVDYRRDKK
jgi:hypothetical protein